MQMLTLPWESTLRGNVHEGGVANSVMTYLAFLGCSSNAFQAFLRSGPLLLFGVAVGWTMLISFLFWEIGTIKMADRTLPSWLPSVRGRPPRPSFGGLPVL
jgi:hypothetical protein